MLANTELSADFYTLNQQYKRLVAGLLDIVDIPKILLEIGPDDINPGEKISGDRIYLIESGLLEVIYHEKSLYTLEDGDLILPDIAGSSDKNATVTYGIDAGASLSSYSALEFMRQIFDDPAASKLWTRILITHQGLLLRINGALSALETYITPGYEIFSPGDTIIKQGDLADFVFNLTEGKAEVVVDGVTVGGIEEGEIFGAMAVLTNATRSATVLARTRCSVVKVPKDQFTDLIKSDPATIHSLLIDMAGSIVNLNEQLVGLRGTYLN
jgi:CRP/FNR family cyclic AMP-dependent transcriptional regulator